MSNPVRDTPAVRAAHARWAARRRRLQGCGLWEPFVPAEPVRQHMQILKELGMPEKAVVEVLGLPRGAMRSVMRGSGTYGPAQKVRKETAEAVLAFWPRLEHFPDSAAIDPVGAVRMVRALAVRGWPHAELAQRSGRAEAAFNNSLRRQRVSARFVRVVAGLYDDLWDQRPEDHGVLPWVADRCRRSAARAGWFGPLAWDDDTIDDPRAEPMVDAVAPVATEGENVAARWLMGESVVLSPDDKHEVLLHLFEWSTFSPGQIAARLEMSESAAEQTWFRHKKKLRNAGQPVPWRRRWDVRVKDLTKNQMNEMGAAA